MKLSEALPFLSDDAIAAEVSRFTYRPGWTLSTFVDRWEGIVFRVTAMVDNAYRPGGDRTELRINSRMPPMRDVEALHEWILWRMMQIEIHECREFLRLDGRMLVDPHDPIEPGPE